MTSSRITRWVLFVSFLILLLLVAAIPGQAANNWGVGSSVGLCKDAPIRTGSGLNYDIHTYVPENGWEVVVKDGPRYADGHTWWDIDRGATGDPAGGTGWVIQSQNEDCPVDGGGGNDGGGGDDGGGSDGGGGILVPQCPEMVPIGVISPDYDIESLSFQSAYKSVGFNMETAARYETSISGGLCEGEVTLQFEPGEGVLLPSLSFDWRTGSVVFNSELAPVGTAVTTGESEIFSEVYPYFNPLIYYPPHYTGVRTVFEITDNPDEPLWGFINLDVINKSGVVTRIRRLEKAYAYVPNLDTGDEYVPSYGVANPADYEVPEWAYYVVYAVGGAAVLLAGGYIIVAVGGAIAGSSTLSALATSILLFLQGPLNYSVNYGVMNAPLQSPESRTHLVMVGESYTAPSAASVDVMDALRDNYGPLIDMATVTTLHTSRDTVSAFTVFEISGEGFTPGQKVYLEMGKPGDKPLFAVALTPDEMGAIEHALQMPPDPDGLPLGTYTITAFDTASMVSNLQQMAKGETQEIDAYIAGATIEVVDDVTPPTITIASPEARPYNRCEIPPVGFTVTDDLSGVDWTTATLDGEQVQNGAPIDMLFWELGDHVLAVQTADKVGNQADEAVTFELEAAITGMQCALDRFYADGLVDGHGTYNALGQQLTAAQAALMRGQQRTAANILSAFEKHVDAQTGKKIDPSAGAIFAMDSDALISEYRAR